MPDSHGAKMEIDEDDDVYVSEESEFAQAAAPTAPSSHAPTKTEHEDLEEGEEEDEDGAMDEDDDDSVRHTRCPLRCTDGAQIGVLLMRE